jgi:hypothetical protein
MFPIPPLLVVVGGIGAGEFSTAVSVSASADGWGLRVEGLRVKEFGLRVKELLTVQVA